VIDNSVGSRLVGTIHLEPQEGSLMRKLAVRAASAAVAAGVIGVGGIAGAGAAVADPASAAALSPTATLGTLVGADTLTRIGYLDGKAAFYPGTQPGPVEVLLYSHFVRADPQCFVAGTVGWQNLDTGASGSQQFALSGSDTAPTGVFFDPGQGRVGITIDTVHELVAGAAQLTT
jgi:hypothetical protein